MAVAKFGIRLTVAWLVGPIIWTLHFFFLYAVSSFACPPLVAIQASQIHLLTLVATIVALSGLCVSLTRQFRQRASNFDGTRDFLMSAGLTLTAIATLGVLWTAAATIILPACTAAAE